MAAVAPPRGPAGRGAGPGNGVATGHGGGVTCLKARGLGLSQTPGHGGGARGEGWQAASVHLGGYCGVEGRLQCTVGEQRQEDINTKKEQKK